MTGLQDRLDRLSSALERLSDALVGPEDPEPAPAPPPAIPPDIRAKMTDACRHASAYLSEHPVSASADDVLEWLANGGGS